MEYKTITKLSRSPSVLRVQGPIAENGRRSPRPPKSPESKAYPVLSVPRFALMMDAQTEEQGRPQETVNMSLELHDDSSDDSDAFDTNILRWDGEDIAAWLREIGFTQYQQAFRDHDISSGSILSQLCENHLKEIGVSRVGHRLELLGQIDQLRSKAGLVQRAKFVDIPTLLKQLELHTTEKHLKLFPKRIILIRHAESQGNVDKSLYAHIPDSQLKITEKGRQQALAAGIKLKELIGSETVTFYVSPFVRSKMTYEHIRLSFQDEQVLFYHEDPRLREQEWGNFQDPSNMDVIMAERRKIGAFYYRFPTGESGADVFDRVSTFLETLYRDMQKGGCGQNTVFISHGLFCRLFLTRYYHWTVEKFHKLWNFTNCQFAIMELQKEGGYKLISELKSDL